MRGCRRSFTFLLLTLLGAAFVVAGVWAGVFGASAATAAADRAERLRPLSASTLEDTAPGGEALIEGRISDRNAPRFRELVAYVRQEYRGSDDDGEEWREDERVTPRLLLDVPGGRAQIGNTDYALESPPVKWQESRTLTWNGLTSEGTKRYHGFAAGDTATAIGTVVSGREGPELRAELLFGGDRAAYIASQRGAAAFLPWFGLIFGVIGLALAAGGVWKLVRR
jgi:hypothetical protein